MRKWMLGMFVVVGVLAFFVLPAAAQAEHGGAAAQSDGGSKTMLGFALAIGLGVAAFGGAMGQGRATAGAVDAVARQPEAGGRIQLMMIIGLALIETLVLYMFLMCFILGGKVG